MRGHCNALLFFFLICCIFTFEPAQALRRIKRGSPAALKDSKPAKDSAHDSHTVVTNTHEQKPAVTTELKQPEKDHLRSKKDLSLKSFIEKPISNFFFPKAHEDDESKSSTGSPSHPPHAQLQYTNTAEIKPSFLSPVIESPPIPRKQTIPLEGSAKDMHKAPLSYLLNNRRVGERIFENMQLDKEFNGNGPEVLIIDNSMQPVVGDHSAYNLHKPNLRSIAYSLQKFGDISGDNNNSNNNGKQSNSNNNNGVKDNKINDSKRNNVALKRDSPNDNKNNNNSNNNSNNNHNMNESNSNNNRKRNNDNSAAQDNDNNSAPQSAASSIADINGLNGNNKIDTNAVNNHKQQQQPPQLQQQQENEQQKIPLMPLLAHSAKTDNTKVPAKQLKHEPTTQQQQQLQSHLNGKVLPVESMIKFANMLLYKMDGPPIHAQHAELSINANPAAVINVSPNVEGADDLDAIDFFYNNLEPQTPQAIHSPLSLPILSGSPTVMTSGPTALMSRPFMLPPYAMNDAPQPLNFLESALDLLLGGAEDDGEDEIELRCPIHHENKKKSTDLTASTAGGSSCSAESGSNAATESKEDAKDGIIQVCSCRFFKKKK